jgi:hypothetical protein
MLRTSLIQSSLSSFSALVLLVKKHDSSWQFYMDYCALNSVTVKDKFPIPIVEELLDELHGMTFFTKIDLWSGYHRVQIATNDIDKSTFCMQEGLFEFLMMSFGLTNVSVTFQAMMNNILRPFLRRFVLVFFDDILILRHVHLVLSKLQEHCLFIKKSKCAFGASSVAYLSHTILAKGVTMDEDKIRTVLESWFHAGQGGGCLP